MLRLPGMGFVVRLKPALTHYAKVALSRIHNLIASQTGVWQDEIEEVIVYFLQQIMTFITRVSLFLILKFEDNFLNFKFKVKLINSDFTQKCTS